MSTQEGTKFPFLSGLMRSFGEKDQFIHYCEKFRHFVDWQAVEPTRAACVIRTGTA